MRMWIGTSGFAYREWVGKFYPARTPSKDMLTYYGNMFSAVEINNTFYKMPEATYIRHWAQQVSADFRFTFKVPQLITHHKKLTNVGSLLRKFFTPIECMETQLGACLLQLPPTSYRNDSLLHEALNAVPERCRVAVEFRHDSWCDESVFDILREFNAALCWTHTDEYTSPQVVTADWGYLRLRACHYSKDDIYVWREHITSQKWHEAFVFFRHEDEAHGTRFARELLDVQAEYAKECPTKRVPA